MKKSLTFPIGGTLLLATAFFFMLNAFLLDNSTSPEPVQAQTAIPAFPGAEGHGATALNDCRSKPMVVHQVTNTNGSGTGSLADIIQNRISDSNFDIIVFRTGGTISVNTLISNSCVYVAGQTAPGGGIQVVGDPPLRINPTDGSGNGNNIVIRYLRLRGNIERQISVMMINHGHDIILDHVSHQWGTDQIFDIYPRSGTTPEAINITLQRSFVAEGLNPHSTASIIGNDYNELKGLGSDPAPSTSNISLHHNVFAHSAHRNPRGSSSNVQVANNVVYNWKGRIGETTKAAQWDYANNTYTKGPWTSSGHTWLRHEACTRNGDPIFPVTPSLYISGNIFNSPGEARTAPNSNQWSFVRHHYTCATTYTAGTELPSSWQRSNPIPSAPIPVILQSAVDAKTSVLADVGANKKLACDGSWQNAQDRIDADIITHIQTGTGPATEAQNDHPDDYGGYPTLASGTPCPDADSDGMPNAWETRYYGSSTGAPAPSTLAASGYTVIEHYLNGTDPVAGGTTPPPPPPPPPPSGSDLVGHWKFDEGTGITAADSSGNNNTGTLTNGPSWTTGKLGSALDFDGTDDLVNAGNDASLTDTFDGGGTWAAWINPRSEGEINGRIMAKDGDVTRFYVDNESAGAVDLRFRQEFDTTSVNWITTSRVIPLNIWTHVAVVYNADSAASDPTLYVNGVAVAINDVSPSGTRVTNAAQALAIGNHRVNSAIRTFDGLIDDVRVYNRALSASEVADLAAGETTPPPPPPPPPAPTASLTANPTSITEGDFSTLTWSSTNATSCTGTNFSTGSTVSGSASVSPASTTTYMVSCTGSGGDATASAQVSVYSPGDLNKDGKVDITDASRMLSRWGSTASADLAEADINGPNSTSDGKVDIYDANTLMANWTG